MKLKHHFKLAMSGKGELLHLGRCSLTVLPMLDDRVKIKQKKAA